MRVHAERRKHFVEFIAGWWFRLSGYLITTRRWRAATNEVNLVVKQRYMLVFVEVSFRFDLFVVNHGIFVGESHIVDIKNAW